MYEVYEGVGCLHSLQDEKDIMGFLWKSLVIVKSFVGFGLD